MPCDQMVLLLKRLMLYMGILRNLRVGQQEIAAAPPHCGPCGAMSPTGYCMVVADNGAVRRRASRILTDSAFFGSMVSG